MAYQTVPFECRNRRNQRISGRISYPSGNGPFPLVIESHGYGFRTSFLSADSLLQERIAYCSFDFCGGLPDSRSDGSSLQMSVLTEAEDLESVLETVRKFPEIDSDRIVLAGGSQGGFVSMVTGIACQDRISGLVLYCPAWIICDFEKVYLSGNPMPERLRFQNLEIGRPFTEDLKGYDPYREMEKFQKPVLYYHGMRDKMVPISYAYEAKKHLPSGEFHFLEDTGHMVFQGHEKQMANELSIFLEKLFK